MQDNFTLPNIDFSTANSNNFTGTINEKGLIEEKKNYHPFTTSLKETVHLKQVSYKLVEKQFNGGDPGDIDRWSAYVDLVVLCQENNKQYKTRYMVISATKSFTDYEFYNSDVYFEIIK